MAEWEPVIGLEIHVHAEDADEDVLPLHERLRRRAEHADVPGLPRLPGRAAGAEPAGDRGDDQARPRARLRDRRARRLPPQELLLSRQPEGVPDLPVRRAALRAAGVWSSRCRTATSRSGSSAPTSRRTPRRTSTSPRPGRIHGATATLVDFNRGGTPLVEIVTEPDIHSADLAKRFLQLLRQTVVELGLSDAELEKGSMRFDVNVSVRPAGSDELRTRTELKNMNSFASRRRGSSARSRARSASTRPAGTVDQETLHFDPAHESSPPLRSKEEARTTATSPSPTSCRCTRRRSSSSGCAARSASCRARGSGGSRETLSFYDADVLVTGGLDALWAARRRRGRRRRRRRRTCSRTTSSATGVDPARVERGRAREADRGARRASRARRSTRRSRASGDDGLLGRAVPRAESVVADVSELDPIDRPRPRRERRPGRAYRGGKEGLLGFFVGQVMKESGGKADPRVVSERLREKLGG